MCTCPQQHQHLAREQGTSLHVPLLNKHTVLDCSIPVHRRFATKTHTNRLCLSGRVIKCWVTASTHHVLTYFSNLPFVFLCCLSHSCEGQTSLALHDSWHSLHPRLWDFLFMEWIWFFLTSAHCCQPLNSWFSQTPGNNLVKSSSTMLTVYLIIQQPDECRDWLKPKPENWMSNPALLMMGLRAMWWLLEPRVHTNNIPWGVSQLLGCIRIRNWGDAKRRAQKGLTVFLFDAH